MSGDQHGPADEDEPTTDRRRLLGLLATGGAVGLAGCGGNGGTPTPGGGSTPTSGGGSTPASGGGGTDQGSPTESVSVSARSLSNLPSGACEQPARTSERSYEGEARIESDTTLGSEADVILFDGGVTVTSGTTLTIEPGTTLAFSQQTGLAIAGTLEASGSCSEPIVFTGQADQPGFWRGLQFGENASGTLDHVLVENGGSERGAGVTIASDGLVDVTNTEVRGSAGAGLHVGSRGSRGESSLASFSGNALTGNEGAAFATTPQAAAGFGSDSAYTGNGTDAAVLRSTTIGENASVELSPLGVPYVVGTGSGGFLTVEGTLTLASGTTVQFGQDGRLSVAGTGTLAADASGGDPISMVGTQDTKGYWIGIQFRTVGTGNVLRNVEVRNAGGGENGQAVLLAGESSVGIENSTIDTSANYGLYVQQGATVPTFDGNTITGNAAAPVWASGQSAHHVVTGGNDLTGNDQDRVTVLADEFDGHAIPEDEDHTWQDPDVPVYLQQGRSGTFAVNGSLTLGQGLDLAFAQDNGIIVNGTMATDVSDDAIPEEFDPESVPDAFVTMRGDQATRGFWKGIGYSASDDTANVLDGLAIRHAGSGRIVQTSFDKEAAVHVLAGSRLKLGTVLIEEVGGYGLFTQLDNELQQLGNVTVRNSQQPAHCYPPTVEQFGGPVTFSGNETDYVDVFPTNQAIPDSFTWPALDVPYRVMLSDSNLVMTLSGDVVVEDGTEIHFTQENAFSIRDGGSLTINGSEDGEGRTTVIRGEQATPGYWTGIRYDATFASENVIDGAEIRHTGAFDWPYTDPPSKGAVAATRGAEATVRNCLIAEQEGAAFAVSPDATLNRSGNTVQ